MMTKQNRITGNDYEHSNHQHECEGREKCLPASNWENLEVLAASVFYYYPEIDSDQEHWSNKNQLMTNSLNRNCLNYQLQMCGLSIQLGINATQNCSNRKYVSAVKMEYFDERVNEECIIFQIWIC